MLNADTKLTRLLNGPARPEPVPQDSRIHGSREMTAQMNWGKNRPKKVLNLC